MNDRPISITPEVLIAAANGHAKAAEYLRTVPASNDAIQACLDSLGPVYAELREEGRAKLEERRLNYQQQADDHQDTADKLKHVHSVWDQGELDAQAAYRALVEGS